MLIAMLRRRFVKVSFGQTHALNAHQACRCILFISLKKLYNLMKIIIINNSVCETFSGTIERCSRTGSEPSVPDVGPVGLIIKAYEHRKEF